MKKCFFLFAFLLSAIITYSQSNLKMSVNPDSIKVGEWANLKWELSVPAGAKVIQTPNFPDSMPSGVEVIERKEVLKTTGNGKDIYNQQLIVSAYDSGFFTIPSIEAKIFDGTDSVNLFYDSLFLYCTTVPVDTSAVAKDVKDIIDVKEEASYKWIWYVLGAVLLAAIGLGVYFYIRKKRKKVSEEEDLVRINPTEYTLERLQKMLESRKWYSVLPKDFYTELVEILRKYLIHAHEIKAEEMLSSELLDAISRNNFSENSISLLKDILSISDMAKFAKYKPEIGQHEKSVVDAISFVKETQPVEKNIEKHEMD